MAIFSVNGSEDFTLRLSKLVEKTDDIAKKAIYEGARVLTDQVRQNLHSVLSEDATGDLEASLGITPIDLDNQGNWNAKIGFDGYDRNGTANLLKARVLESGSSKQQKRPFFRKAVNSKKKEAIQAMESVINEEFSKI